MSLMLFVLSLALIGLVTSILLLVSTARHASKMEDLIIDAADELSADGGISAQSVERITRLAARLE